MTSLPNCMHMLFLDASSRPAVDTSASLSRDPLLCTIYEGNEMPVSSSACLLWASFSISLWPPGKSDTCFQFWPPLLFSSIVYTSSGKHSLVFFLTFNCRIISDLYKKVQREQREFLASPSINILHNSYLTSPVPLPQKYEWGLNLLPQERDYFIILFYEGKSSHDILPGQVIMLVPLLKGSLICLKLEIVI